MKLFRKVDKKMLEKCRHTVIKMQKRILHAFEAGDLYRVNKLILLFMRSFEVTLVAVYKVYLNPGGKTPGVDKVVWRTPAELLDAAHRLKSIKGYQAQRLRRIYFDKETGRKLTEPRNENSKVRPLSIPVMDDRVQQMKAKMALEPITEKLADKCSFGFRPRRSTYQALDHCEAILIACPDLQFVLEGDIKACFDQISHDFILANFPVTSLAPLITQWLRCGFIEEGVPHETDKGTPQGGIISPLLANLVLDGMENLIEKTHVKCKFARYADDFVVFCDSYVVSLKLKEVIGAFMQERGLELSPNKTHITPVKDGFDFLGVNLRKTSSGVERRPSKKSIERLLTRVDLILSEADPASRSFPDLDVFKTSKGWERYHRDWLDRDRERLLYLELSERLARWRKLRSESRPGPRQGGFAPS